MFSYADGSRREGTWSSGELDGFVFYYEGDRLVRAERWFRGKKLSDKQTPTTESTTVVTRFPQRQSFSLIYLDRAVIFEPKSTTNCTFVYLLNKSF